MAYASAACTGVRLPAVPMLPSIGAAMPAGVFLCMGLGKSIFSAFSSDHEVSAFPLSSIALRGGMQICKKTLADRTITADVELLSLLLSLREGMRISVKTLANKTITLDSEAMDGRTLSDYSAQKESILFLLLNLHGGMQVSVKTMADKIIILDIELVDGRILSDYSFPKEYTLPLLPCLRGDMQIYVKHLADQAIISDVGAKQFEDGHILSHYDIQRETSLQLSLLLSLHGGMQISVTTMAGKTFILDVELVDGRILSDYSTLRIIADKLLEDGRNSLEYDAHIQQESTFQLVPRLGGGMHIWTSENMVISLDAEASDTSDNVQAKVPCKKDIVTVWQRLTLVSKQLEDDLHLVLRLCGGMTMLAHTQQGKIEYQTNLVPNPSIPAGT